MDNEKRNSYHADDTMLSKWLKLLLFKKENWWNQRKMFVNESPEFIARACMEEVVSQIYNSLLKDPKETSKKNCWVTVDIVRQMADIIAVTFIIKAGFM